MRGANRGGKQVVRKSGRSGSAAFEEAEPLLVTAWGDFVIEGGVLFVPFKCGAAQYMLAMGPTMAHEAIALAQRVLSGIHRDNLASMAAHRRSAKGAS